MELLEHRFYMIITYFYHLSKYKAGILTKERIMEMLNVLKAGIIGLIFGFAVSVIISLVFSVMAQSASGGITSLLGESWLYYATLVPFSIAFLLLGMYFTKYSVNKDKKLWVISLIAAFLITLYTGTIGAIFGEFIVRGGMETINVEETLKWGTIYSFLFLPFTVPISWLVIKAFRELMNRFKLLKVQ